MALTVQAILQEHFEAFAQTHPLAVGGGQDRYQFGGGGRGGLPEVDVREWLVECGRPRGGGLLWKGTEVEW